MECYRCPYRCLCQDFLIDMNCEDALNYTKEENGKTRLTKHGGHYCDDCGNIRDEYCRCDKEIEMYNKLAAYEDAEEQGLLVRLPCKVGDTVYRICPKCNSKHDGSCVHCAWQGTGGIGGCTVFGLWGDGQYPAEKCTILPWVASWHRMETVIRYLGTRIFLTRAEAEAALKGEKDDV